MIIILASRWDSTADGMAATWAHRSVGVLTPQDLCAAGWRQHVGWREHVGTDGSDPTPPNVAVVQRRQIPQQEITGVLTRLPWVTDGEIVEIAAQDRAYAAAEMTSFLLCWLSQLKCPVLNPPTPLCLSGPYWRAERWVHMAARAGIPVQPIGRDTREELPADASPAPAAAVTVVGRRIFGEADSALLSSTRRLAELANVALLTVRFSGAERGATFMGADTFPALDDAILSEAVLDYLCGTSAAYS
jgi:hypothetical protein